MVQNMTCQDMQKCVAGNTVSISNSSISNSVFGITAHWPNGKVEADQLECRQMEEACFTAHDFGLTVTISNSAVIDSHAVVDSTAIGFRIEVANCLFLRNYIVFAMADSTLHMIDTVVAYNTHGPFLLQAPSSLRPAFVVERCTFLGNAVALYMSEEPYIVNDVTFAHNEVGLGTTAEFQDEIQVLCTSLSNATFIENSVAISTSAVFNGECEGGLQRVNFLTGNEVFLNYRGTEEVLMVPGLYWGTTILEDIRSKIPDVFVDPSYGIVQIEPIATFFFLHSMFPEETSWTEPAEYLGVLVEGFSPTAS